MTIDFAALAGRRVVVIGVGASAVDNAAEALEAGAAEVRLLARRDEDADDQQADGHRLLRPRRRLAGDAAGVALALHELRRPAQQTPAPRNSTQRVSRHPNAYFHFGATSQSMRDRERRDAASAPGRPGFETDFVILGTGFAVDHAARPEFADSRPEIASWGDRYTPAAGGGERRASPPIPGSPTTSPSPRESAGDAPFLAQSALLQLRCDAQPREGQRRHSGDQRGRGLARRVASPAGFFNADVEHHWAAIQAYSKPELLGDEWDDADAASGPEARAI